MNVVPAIGSPLRVLLSVLACGTFAHAANITLYGNTADSEVHYGGIWSYDPGQNGGMVGVNGGYDYSDVFVFQLPVLAPGQTITGSDFSFYDTASGSKYNVDLYGLGYRASPTVLASDWYSGPNDSQNALIQAGIIAPSYSFAGRITTSSGADLLLTNYLNSQYAAGGGGNYVFLRLSNSVSGGDNLNVDFIYHADVAYYLDNAYPGTLSYWQGLYSPRLDLTLGDAPTSTPEPSTMAALAGGLGLCAALRKRYRPATSPRA